MSDYDVYTDASTDAWRSLTEVIVSPHLGTYEPHVAAIREAMGWLELDISCGDCIEGRCHYGGEESRLSTEAASRGEDYDSPKWGQCGCARHELSVEVRNWRRAHPIAQVSTSAAVEWRVTFLNRKRDRVQWGDKVATEGEADALLADATAAGRSLEIRKEYHHCVVQPGESNICGAWVWAS